MENPMRLSKILVLALTLSFLTSGDLWASKVDLVKCKLTFATLFGEIPDLDETRKIVMEPGMYVTGWTGGLNYNNDTYSDIHGHREFPFSLVNLLGSWSKFSMAI